MNAHEKETERVLLEDEKEVLKQLDKTYKQAQNDVNTKLKEIDNQLKDLIKKQTENKDPEQAEFIESQIRAKVYQKKYQQALKDQINGYLDALKSKHIESINDYLKVTYEDGFLTNIYNLQKYGIPVTVPINQELLVKSITYPTEKIPLSKRLYDNIEKTKKKVISEVSRGIATGSSYNDIARNIQNQLGVSFRKAKQIAQNEGQRVKTDARIDSMYAARKKGADIVKQWDSTLDNKTRPVHAELDGQWAELNKPFKCSAGEVQAPKKFGIAALDINCRCVLLSVPRWDIEDTVQKRDNITGELIEAKNYYDWKEKYYQEINTLNYSSKKARVRLQNADASSIQKGDKEVIEVFGKIFKGYKPSPLKNAGESSMTVKRIKNNDGTYKIERYVVNSAIPSGETNVDIGNAVLANELHERTHDIVTQLAIDRAGIKDENHVTEIQYLLFQKEKQKIQEEVYIYCFTDETFEEINDIIEKEISCRARASGHEFIAESFVQYLGASEHSNLSKKVYNYLVKEWKKK